MNNNDQSNAQEQPMSTETPKMDSNPAEVEYAGFLTRFIAILIDAVIIGFVGALLRLPGFNYTTSGGSVEMGASGFVPTLIYVTYFTVMDVKFGQTLGKMAMKIKVQKEDNGQNLDFVSAILREFVGRLVCSLTLLIGYFWVIWDSKNQGLHDKIGKSVVVKVKK